MRRSCLIREAVILVRVRPASGWRILGEVSGPTVPAHASSTEYNVGTLIGATHRFNDHASADLGIGYNWGSVGSAGAGATINTFLTTIGGRYGFSSLETGPFVTARADAGYAY